MAKPKPVPDLSALALARLLRASSYTVLTYASAEEFLADYARLGAQRNAKIIGIFVRLWQRDGKPRYLDYIPRVWALLERDLTHPALAPVTRWFSENIPEELRAAGGDRVEQRAAHGRFVGAPILEEEDYRRTYGGREFRIFKDGNRIRMIGLKNSNGSYWVSNTLLQQLTNKQMIAIARSLGKLSTK